MDGGGGGNSSGAMDGTIMKMEQRENGIASFKIWLTSFACAGGWTLLSFVFDFESGILCGE